MNKPKYQVIINGQPVDLASVEQSGTAQALLVPANWPVAKDECIRLFVATEQMLVAALRKHLVYNWKKISEVARNQEDRGEGARVGISFSFEIDHSARMVAALPAAKMSFSEKFSSKSKPVTRDITQGDLFEDQGPLNADAIAEEEQDERREKEEKEREAERVKAEKEKAAKEKELKAQQDREFKEREAREHQDAQSELGGKPKAKKKVAPKKGRKR